MAQMARADLAIGMSRFRIPLIVGFLLLAAITTAALADPFGRDALRSVVAACQLSKATLGVAFPCVEVETGGPNEAGYAIIHSPGFASEYLLTPLADYDGIESPELRGSAATGFWHAAWAMQRNVEEALGRTVPRTGLALAVNATGTRTQDHFHIHLDCLRTSVGAALARLKAVDGEWRPVRQPLRGDSYWVRAIRGADLAGVNVAQLIAEAPPAGDHPMGDVTLAVVGATLPDGSEGFYLLANWRNKSAERLLDHRCRAS
jgi:CDP-diacylglycerol pyrophosphatase